MLEAPGGPSHARDGCHMSQQDVPVHCQNNSKVEGPTATGDFFLKFEIQPLTAGLKTRLRNPSEDPNRISVTSITKKEFRVRKITKKFIRFKGGTVLPLVLYSNRGKYGTACLLLLQSAK